MRSRLERLVTRWPIRCAVLLAVLLGLPSLRSGLMLDDHAHLAAIRGEWPLRWWDLFRFVPGNPSQTAAWIARGPLPWWTDPELKLAFFRPLSSALIRFDVAAFGERYSLFHAHSLLWTGLWVALAGVVLRSVLPARLAILATLLFAVAPHHWAPVYWLASRNAIVASVFVLAAVHVHVRHREGRFPAGLFLAPLLFGAALLGGEAALGGLGYFVAYEALAAPKAGRRTSLVGVVVVTLLWFVAYRAMGYGTSASGFYADPVNEPASLLRELPARALTQLGTIVLLVPSHIGVFDPRAVAPQLTVGAVALVVAIGAGRLAWRELAPDERRAVRWLVVGGAVAVVPGLSSSPGPRSLAVSSLGFAVLVAFWITGAKRRLARAPNGAASARIAFVGLVALHGVAPFLYWPGFAFFSQRSLAAGRREAIALSLPSPGEGRLVLLTASDPPTGLYLPFVRREAGLPLLSRYWLISVIPVAHRVKRIDLRTYELEPVGRRFCDTPFEKIFRRRPTGDRRSIVLDGLDVTPIETEDGAPKRLVVRVAEPLERTAVVAWSGGHYVSVVDMAIGEERLLER